MFGKKKISPGIHYLLDNQDVISQKNYEKIMTGKYPIDVDSLNINLIIDVIP